METAVEALNVPRENTDEGGAWVSEISEPEFRDESCAFAPIKRIGFSNGPGASFGGEHRFAEALTDLDAARRLGAEPAAVREPWVKKISSYEPRETAPSMASDTLGLTP
jgi:hypothetical protein